MIYRILPILLLGLLTVSCGKSGENKDGKKPADSSTSNKSSQTTPDAKTAKKSELDGAKLNKTEKRSYLIGIELGRQWAMRLRMSSNGQFDSKAFLVGVKDAMEGNKMALTQDQIKAVIKDVEAEREAKLRERFKATIEKNKKFLDDLKKKPGIVQDPSGILYKVVKKGTGASPTLKDKVKVHYAGLLISGKEFDSSISRGKPVVFDLSRGGLIKGWISALPKMKEGARWKIYIPSDLGYGWRGAPGIPPFQTLVFNIELIKVNPEPEKPKAPVKKPEAKKEEKKDAKVK